MDFDESVYLEEAAINFQSDIRDVWNVPLETTSLELKLDNEIKPNDSEAMFLYIT